MRMEQLIETVRGRDGALAVIPGPGSDAPEIAWGDAFFYYAPDGEMPQHGQPYATIVTKDYPDDTSSELDAPDRWRVNIQVDRTTFRLLTGEEPRSLSRTRDYGATDVFTPHPVYGALSWVSVVNPAEQTGQTVERLLREAHEAARARFERRRETGAADAAEPPPVE